MVYSQETWPSNPRTLKQGSTKCWSTGSTTWHTRGVEEGQIHLNSERNRCLSHPRCYQGLKLPSLVCLTRWSYSLAGQVTCPASRCKGGWIKRVWHMQWARAQTLRLRQSRIKFYCHVLALQPSASNLTSLASKFPRLWDGGTEASTSLDLGEN